jgi:hypothetical protein
MPEAYADQPDRLAATVRRIKDVLAELLGDTPPGRIEVPGDEPVARRLRDALGTVATERKVDRPAAVVDTSGSPEQLVDALTRLDTLGVLVLASAKPASDTDLDVYASVHRRSLTVVAVPVESEDGDGRR